MRHIVSLTCDVLWNRGSWKDNIVESLLFVAPLSRSESIAWIADGDAITFLETKCDLSSTIGGKTKIDDFLFIEAGLNGFNIVTFLHVKCVTDHVFTGDCPHHLLKEVFVGNVVAGHNCLSGAWVT